MNLRCILRRAAFLLMLTSGPVFSQTITNVTPPLGATNDANLVFLDGTGFSAGTLTVTFNGIKAVQNTGIVNANRIQTQVPAGATTGFIWITNNSHAARSPNQFLIISSNAYVTNFSPMIGGPNTQVVLTGVHFSTATNVLFNGLVSKTVPGVTPNIQQNSITVTAPDGVTTGPLTVMSSLGATHDFSTSSNIFFSATNFFAEPVVTSFSPTNGRAGTNVVILGTNFIGATAVLFGGVSASFGVLSNTAVQATVPNTSSGVIEVDTPFPGSLQSSTSFRILPSIFSFTPGSGPIGTVVTVTGAGLNEQSPHPAVTVGAGTVTSFGTVSPGTLSFTVPGTATTGFITVTTTNGSISSAQLFYLPPSISSFTPTAGGPGTIVIISGNNFTNASAVSFNGTPAAAFGVTNNSTIGAIVPGGITSGTISVTTPGGTATSTEVFLGPPSIINFTPTHGSAGTNVTITGLNFTNATAVLFNGVTAVFSVTNNTTIGAFVPGGATTGPITVQGPGGTNTSAANFTIDSTDLGITVTGAPNPVFIGSNLVYTIAISNLGTVAATNVRLTNTLDNNVRLRSASTSQGSLVTNTIPITGNLGTINNGGFATVSLVVTSSVTGTITNKASVGSDLPDSNGANNSSVIVTTVWPLPLLSISNVMGNNQVQVSWPAPLNGFTLQFATNISPIVNWSNDTGSKVVSGTNVSVTESIIGTARFFRLTN